MRPTHLSRRPKWEDDLDEKATQIGRDLRISKAMKDLFESLTHMQTKIEGIQRPSDMEPTQQARHTTILCRKTYLFSERVHIFSFPFFSMLFASPLFFCFKIYSCQCNAEERKEGKYFCVNFLSFKQLRLQCHHRQMFF